MNKANDLDAQQTLAAWRAQGADRLNPMRFALIQAMANRADALADGEAKRVVLVRLAELVRDYAVQVDAASPTAQATSPQDQPATTTPDAVTLPGLLHHLASLSAPVDARCVSSSVGSLRQRYPELPLLDEFRSTWSRVNANRQVRQSEEQVHENAGPLNSNHLVHRALSMMRDVSPGYLHQFLEYLDALAWVEQLHLCTEPAAKETKRQAGKTTKTAKSATGRAKKKTPKADT